MFAKAMTSVGCQVLGARVCPIRYVDPTSTDNVFPLRIRWCARRSLSTRERARPNLTSRVSDGHSVAARCSAIADVESIRAEGELDVVFEFSRPSEVKRVLDDLWNAR